MKKNSAKILFIDIETSPLEVYVWNLGEQRITINQIIKDRTVLSVSAKWSDSKEILYKDTRNKKDPRYDKDVVQFAFDLINSADVICAQNGKRFDTKILYGRFAILKMGSPKPFQQVDTLQIARKHFNLPSYKLEYMCKVFGLKNKKLKSKKFIGQDLWTGCLNKDIEAWKEMELYNKQDVFALENLYHFLLPYGIGINLSIYNEDTRPTCNCGSTKLQSRGTDKQKTGIYRRYQCQGCGSWMTDKSENLMSQDKKESLKLK